MKRKNKEKKRTIFDPLMEDKTYLVSGAIFIFTGMLAGLLGTIYSLLDSLGLEVDIIAIIAILGIISSVFVLILRRIFVEFNPQHRKYGELDMQWQNQPKEDNNVGVQMKKWIILICWVSVVALGILAIGLYINSNGSLEYRFVTLLALIGLVLWNIVSTNFYKPLYSQPIKKYWKAFEYICVSETPNILSYSSVIIGIIYIGENSQESLIFTLLRVLLVASCFISVQVVIERGITMQRLKF